MVGCLIMMHEPYRAKQYIQSHAILQLAWLQAARG